MTDESKLTLSSSRSAVIVQEMQNDVIGEGGAFADSGAPSHAKSQGVVENVARLVTAARSHGVPVFHVHHVVRDGGRGLAQNAPVFRGIKEVGALQQGTWGAAAVVGLEPQADDIIVEKTRMNAFFGTKLELLLRGLGIETIVMTGAWTNMSIEHTARHAADMGFQVVVASDGTSTVDEQWQQAALGFALPNVAEIRTCAEIVASLDSVG